MHYRFIIQTCATNLYDKFRELYTTNLYKCTNADQKRKWSTLARLITVDLVTSKRNRGTRISPNSGLPGIQTIFKGKVDTLRKRLRFDAYIQNILKKSIYMQQG